MIEFVGPWSDLGGIDEGGHTTAGGVKGIVLVKGHPGMAMSEQPERVEQLDVGTIKRRGKDKTQFYQQEQCEQGRGAPGVLV